MKILTLSEFVAERYQKNIMVLQTKHSTYIQAEINAAVDLVHAQRAVFKWYAYCVLFIMYPIAAVKAAFRKAPREPQKATETVVQPPQA